MEDEANRLVGALFGAVFGSRAMTDTPRKAFCGGGMGGGAEGTGAAGSGVSAREVFALYTGRVGSPKTMMIS